MTYRFTTLCNPYVIALFNNLRLQFFRWIVLLGVSCLFSFHGLAQSLPPAMLSSQVTSVLPVSPNAAALGKFTEVPVSLYTGIPSTTIPLWQLTQGDIGVDISLDYHGGGIKVDEVSSSVGLGWALRVGGMITRQTHGLPDNPETFAQLELPELKRYMRNQIPLNSREHWMYHYKILNETADSQPDVYLVNVGSLSARFFMDTTGTYVVTPREANIRIQYRVRDASNTFYTWIITDAGGIQYKFQESESTESQSFAKEGGQPTSDGRTYRGESSWVLNEIQDTKGNVVRFTYYPEGTTETHIASEYVKVPPAVQGGGACSMVFGNTTAITYTNTLVVKDITCGKEQIRFIRKTTPRLDMPHSYPIESVQVVYDGVVKKKFRLFTSYWGTDPQSSTPIAPDGDRYRLRLDSIQEGSEDDNVRIPAYTFGYNARELPHRNALSKDHWGFSNGKQNTVGVSYWAGNELRGADKNPDPYYAIASTLETVRYPTGGRVHFTYEPNIISSPGEVDSLLVTMRGNNDASSTEFNFTQKFTVPDPGPSRSTVPITVALWHEENGGPPPVPANANFVQPLLHAVGSTNYIPITVGQPVGLPAGEYELGVTISTEYAGNPYIYFEAQVTGKFYRNVNKFGPGLRIQKVEKFFANGQSLIQRYTYQDPVTGGSSGGVLNSPEYTTRTSYTSGAGNCTYDVYSSQSAYPLINSRASFMVYSYVTEYTSGTTNNGKTEYAYSIFGDANGSSGTPFPPASSYEWRRGLLTAKKVYKSLDSAPNYELVLSEAYHYDQLPGSQQFGYGLKIAPINTYSSVDSVSYVWQNMDRVIYPIIAESYQLRSKVITQYARRQEFASESAYGYTRDTFLPNKVVTTNSDATQTIQRTFYPGDYKANAGSSATLSALLSAHLLRLPVEQTISRKSATGLRLTSGVVHQFGVESSIPGVGTKVYLQKLYALKTTGTADTTRRYTFLQVPSLYEEKSHITTVSSRSQPVTIKSAGNTVMAYQWGYEDRYVVAECKNATEAEFLYQGFEEEASATRGTGHTGTGYMTGAYTVTWTPPNARRYVLSYWFRQGGVWKRQELPYTGTSSLLTGGDAYDDVCIYPQGALMTTYTYEPLVGITAQITPDGRTATYEYDPLGRLLRVRDDKGNILKEHQYHYARP